MTSRFMKLCSFLLVLSTAPLASAALVDGWTVSSAAVKDSVARKADGSEIRFDRKDEVVVEMWVETLREYGSPQQRRVKSVRTQAPRDGQPGRVQVEIQTESEFECSGEGRGLSLAMMGPHRAALNLVAAPGIYDLAVNDAILGRLTIGEQSASLEPNPNYKAEIAGLNDREFTRLFGLSPEQPLTLAKPGCSVQVTDVPGAYAVSFSFEGSTQTLNDGSILTRPAVQGNSRLTSRRVEARCGDRGQVSGWKAELQGNDSVLTLSVSAQGPVRASYRTGSGKTCFSN